jgi:uncharacterized protein with PQ loop repeat
MNLPLNFLVLIASALGSAMAFPQARRLVRTRCVEGISASWIGVSLALNAWWFTYGIGAGVWAVVPVSAISFVIYATIAVVYVHTTGRTGATAVALGAVALGFIPVPFGVLGGWELLGIAIGLCYGLQLLPAVVGVHRTRELSGVSSATWFLAAVESVIWFLYGLVARDSALTLAGVVGVAMSGLILARLAATGHRPLGAFAAARRPVPAQ